MKESLFKLWGGFDLKGGVSLDTNVLSTLFLYIQLFVSGLCP